MIKNLIRDFNVYRLCPEVRSHVRQMYAAKLVSYSSMVVLSPLILIGLLSVGLVHVIDYIGQFSLWPAHKVTTWLHNYQQRQIKSAHSVLSLEEVQKRIGTETRLMRKSE